MESEMTTSDVKDLKAAFSLLDTNRDGKVNASELKSMMETMGIKVSDEQIQNLIAQASTTGDGLISEDEFMQFMSTQSTADSDDVMHDLVAAFRVFDKDSNGYISRDELKRAMEMIGENVSESCLDELLRAADIDQDGRINYEEFARMLL
ncbi:hypothetical protein CHUAL_003127 [Chamberlinius hualienensis]